VQGISDGGVIQIFKLDLQENPTLLGMSALNFLNSSASNFVDSKIITNTPSNVVIER
jgi:hypothetical protein